jgi:FkbM family methyltransferase
MKAFEESDRLNHDFGPEDVILDIGAHEGWFTGELWNKFGCYIYAFEPVARFREQCERRFDGNRKVVVFPWGIGGSDRVETFGVKGDMTGLFCAEPNEQVEVEICDISRAIHYLGLHEIGLVSINCEGGEYELLERLLETGDIRKIRNLSVQMHTVVPDYQARCATLFKRLEETHDHVYGAPFIWDGFKLRA